MMSYRLFNENTEPDISRKLVFNWKKVLFSAVFAVILLSWCFGFANKLIDYFNLTAEEALLIQEEKKLYEHIDTLEKEKEYLQQDWYIEKLARDRLNLVKPGEVLIKVIPPENP